MGAVGSEPELGATTDPTADLGADLGGADAAAPADGDLLASPPGKREDKKGRTTTDKSHGWYSPRDLTPGGDRRKSSGPRKKNMNRAASPETGTIRKMFPGMEELSGLGKATSIYEEQKTNYKVEETKILKEEKELDTLFKSLKARDEKNETKT